VRLFRRHVSRALSIGVLLAGVGLPAAAEFKASWDQVMNIRDAAERIGRLQRVKGASAAYTFIDACYRTHGLSEKYSAGFEGCIAQDYIQTKMLAQVYTRVEPGVLKKMGAPTAEALAQAMGRRISTAFAQYKVPVAYVEQFKKLVDEHGMPAFVKIVFPKPPPGTSPEQAPQAPEATPAVPAQPEKK